MQFSRYGILLLDVYKTIHNKLDIKDHKLSQPNPLQEKNETESEISLISIIEFVKDSWKYLVLAGIVGGLLGFSGWYFLGSFKSQIVLLNNTNINSKSDTYGLDLVTWRTLQNFLPGLASQIVAQNNLAAEQKGIYSAMSDPKWWASNIIPRFAISKADASGLAMISKNLDSAATTIMSFSINSDGASKEKSLDNVRIASQFFKSGGAYLQIKILLNHYEGKTVSTVAEIQNKITQAQIEKKYYLERVKTLEALLKQFPNRNTVVVPTETNYPNENISKYLPVESQLIAANNDLNQIQETLNRLNDQHIQIKFMKQFIDQAIPLTKNQLDGILLTNTLLTVEESLRKQLLADDLRGKLILDELRYELLKIEARYVTGLEAATAPTTSKAGMLKTLAESMVFVEVLMLMYLMGRRLIGRLKLTVRA